MTRLLPDEPGLRRLARLTIDWRETSVVGVAGERPGRRHGASREFAGVRAYEPGDDPRDVDWAVSARSSRLHVRQYRHEIDAALLLLVDTSASMVYGEPAKLEYACALAATLGYVALHHRDAVAAVTFSEGAVGLMPFTRGRGGWRSLRSLLGAARAQGRAELGEAVRRLPFAHVHRGVAVVLSDGWPPDGLAVGLRRLASAGLAVTVVQVLAPDEFEPAVAGEVALVDLETGETRSGWVGDPERLRYRARFDAARAHVSAVCRAAGARHVEVSTAIPIPTCVTTTLVRARVLRRSRV